VVRGGRTGSQGALDLGGARPAWGGAGNRAEHHSDQGPLPAAGATCLTPCWQRRTRGRRLRGPRGWGWGPVGPRAQQIKPARAPAMNSMHVSRHWCSRSPKPPCFRPCVTSLDTSGTRFPGAPPITCRFRPVHDVNGPPFTRLSGRFWDSYIFTSVTSPMGPRKRSCGAQMRSEANVRALATTRKVTSFGRIPPLR
jgi:hypothetical protein